MSLVSKGQGRDGTAAPLLVTGGLGTTDAAPVDPNDMAAGLAGTSTLTAVLTDGTAPPAAVGGGGIPRPMFDETVDVYALARLDDDLLLLV